PISLPASDPVSTITITQKASTAHLVRRPLGSPASRCAQLARSPVARPGLPWPGLCWPVLAELLATDPPHGCAAGPSGSYRHTRCIASSEAVKSYLETRTAGPPGTGSRPVCTAAASQGNGICRRAGQLRGGLPRRSGQRVL